MEDQFRDTRGLGRTVVLWTWIWIVCQVLFALACVYEMSVLSGLPGDTEMTMTSGPPEAAVSDITGAGTGLLAILSFWVSGILILRWIYLSNRNAQGFVDGMTVSPGWNVGWFFVPFANLIKPFQGVRETWQASRGEPSWPDVEVPGFMRWWWGFWLASNFIDNASFRLSLRVETVSQELTVAALSILSGVISIPLGLFLMKLVRELSEAQTMVHNNLVFR